MVGSGGGSGKACGSGCGCGIGGSGSGSAIVLSGECVLGQIPWHAHMCKVRDVALGLRASKARHIVITYTRMKQNTWKHRHGGSSRGSFQEEAYGRVMFLKLAPRTKRLMEELCS